MINTLFCSSTHMRIVRADKNKKIITIHSFAELPLPEGAMSGDRIADVDIMIGFLRDASKVYGLDKGETTLIVENRYIRIKRIKLPALEQSAAIAAVHESFDTVKGTENDIICDYSVTDAQPDQGGYNVLAISARKDMLESYVDALQSAGINLRKIVIGASCRTNAKSIDIKDVTFASETGLAPFNETTYLLNIGALVDRNKKLHEANLIHPFEAKRSIFHSHKRMHFTIKNAAIAAVTVFFVAFGIFYFVRSASLQDQITTVSAYLNDSSVKADYEKSNEALKQSKHAREMTDFIKTASGNLETYPELTSAQLTSIDAEAAKRKTVLTKISFNATDGTLAITGLSEASTYIPQFISVLRSTGWFTDIAYDGYTEKVVASGKPNDKTTTKKYTFEAKANLKPPTSDAAASDSQEEGGATDAQ